MVERCSHPDSDVIYHGFSGSSGAEPPPTPPRRPASRPRRRLGPATAIGAVALGVAAVAAVPSIERLWPRSLPSVAAVASVARPPAAAPPRQTAPVMPPPEAIPLETPPAAASLPEVPRPDPDKALIAASAPPSAVFRHRPHRRPIAPRAGLGEAARERASAATAQANLDETYAPQSTLGAQAVAEPPGD